MFTCRGVKLAHFLISHNLVCKSVEIDKNDSTYLVYKFDRTEELEKLMEIWQNNRK